MPWAPTRKNLGADAAFLGTPGWPAASNDPLGVSRWMNGMSHPPPLGFEHSWKCAILERQQNYRSGVEDQLQRPVLQPTEPGARESILLLGWEFPIHVVGLDTAWLCGDYADADRILLTETIRKPGRRRSCRCVNHPSARSPRTLFWPRWHVSPSPITNRMEAAWVGLLEPGGAKATIRLGSEHLAPGDADLMRHWCGSHSLFLQPFGSS
jgi:hypothetical protein